MDDSRSKWSIDSSYGPGLSEQGRETGQPLDLSMTGRAEPLTVQVENEGSVALRNGGDGLVWANVGSEVLGDMDVLIE